MKEITLNIEGMHCEVCVQRVTSAIKKVEGVNEVTVDLKGKSALVKGDVANDSLKEAVEDIGFEIVGINEK